VIIRTEESEPTTFNQLQKYETSNKVKKRHEWDEVVHGKNRKMKERKKLERMKGINKELRKIERKVIRMQIMSRNHSSTFAGSIYIHIQGRIYSCGGPGAIEMWRPLSVTANLGYIAITYK
jgi:hypothetical protein